MKKKIIITIRHTESEHHVIDMSGCVSKFEIEEDGTCKVEYLNKDVI